MLVFYCYIITILTHNPDHQKQIQMGCLARKQNAKKLKKSGGAPSEMSDIHSESPEPYGEPSVTKWPKRREINQTDARNLNERCLNLCLGGGGGVDYKKSPGLNRVPNEVRADCRYTQYKGG